MLLKAQSATLTGALNAQSATLTDALNAQSAKIAGRICAKEVIVSLSGSPCWPDYVFKKVNSKRFTVRQRSTGSTFRFSLLARFVSGNLPTIILMFFARFYAAKIHFLVEKHTNFLIYFINNQLFVLFVRSD